VIQLVVTLKGRTVGRYDVEGTLVRIGRLPDNEVQIDNRSVSRLHCVLEHESAEGWFLEDKGSHNGTYVNGAKVQTRTKVRNGDTIGVGQFMVSLRAAETDMLASSSIGSRISVRASRDPETREKLASEKGYLLRENSPGAPIPLVQDLCQLGSAPGLDVAIPGPPKRALIVRGYGGFQLVNVGAAAEVTRNGQPVADRAWLEEDDLLVIGPLRFTFYRGLPCDESDQATVFLQLPPGGFKPPSKS